MALTRIDPTGPDNADLVDFFVSEEFPFHVVTDGWSAQTVRERIASGYFCDDENESFWLNHDEFGRVGFVRLEDLHDDTPMFDLRLAARFRGRGLGVEALAAITDHLFSMTQARRIEGQARDDNHAMRTVFVKAGWTKEAHYRRAWPVAGGTAQDSIAYALLREEWKTGIASGLHWHDHSWFRQQRDSGITFTSNVMPTRDELVDLYESAGWTAYTCDAERLLHSVLGSAHVVCAWDRDALVGLARVVSDFGTLVYLQDVLVNPDLHRQGIGRRLISRVLEPFADVRQTVLLTDSDPGLSAFYSSLGFIEASPSTGSSLRAFVR